LRICCAVVVRYCLCRAGWICMLCAVPPQILAPGLVEPRMRLLLFLPQHHRRSFLHYFLHTHPGFHQFWLTTSRKGAAPIGNRGCSGVCLTESTQIWLRFGWQKRDMAEAEDGLSSSKQYEEKKYCQRGSRKASINQRNDKQNDNRFNLRKEEQFCVTRSLSII
jgi:hypothetical protein